MIDIDRCRYDTAYRMIAKELLLSNFKLYIEHSFYWDYRKPFIFNDHHYKIIEFLNKVYLGEITYGIINMPPRYSKTELAIKRYISWTYAKNASCKYIHLSYDDPLAISNSESILDSIASDWFTLLFGSGLRASNNSRKLWRTNDDGEFYAISAGKGITGHGAGSLHEYTDDGGYIYSGGIFIDDPLKPDDAHSTVKRQTVNRRWDETIKSRRNSNRTPVVVIMQRLHEDDFCGHLLNDSEFTWDVLRLQALSDDGKALWPQKHTAKQLESMKVKNRYVFAGQYQQTPTPAGGGIFKDEWWKFFAKEPPKIQFRFIVGDTAMKAKTVHDYSVFICFAFADGRLYVLDMIRGKWEAPELEIVYKAFWNKWIVAKPRPRGTYIEDKASGTGLIQKITREAHSPVIPMQRNIDKVTRANDTAPYVQSGYVYLPMSAPWLSDFLSELGAFSPAMTHKNDDICDVVFDAVKIAFEDSPISMFDVVGDK